MDGSAHSDAVHGVRVLVVEDVLLVADLIADGLRDQGCEVVGPAARLEQGLELAKRESLDGVLLDINLAGKRGFPIADALAQRGVAMATKQGVRRRRLPHRLVAAAAARLNPPRRSRYSP